MTWLLDPAVGKQFDGKFLSIVDREYRHRDHHLPRDTSWRPVRERGRWNEYNKVWNEIKRVREAAAAGRLAGVSTNLSDFGAAMYLDQQRLMSTPPKTVAQYAKFLDKSTREPRGQTGAADGGDVEEEEEGQEGEGQA